MRILWLSHLIPYPPKGGVLQRSFNLINEVSRYHDVDLLAFNQKNLIRPLFPTLEQGVNEAHNVLSDICCQVEFFDIPNEQTDFTRYKSAFVSLFSKPYNINWLKSRDYSLKLSEWIRVKRYDLVHFDTISLIPYFSHIVGDTATCLDHHNIESHMLLRRAQNEKNYLKKIYYWQEGLRLQKYEKKYCPQFTLNITCSDLDTERLQKLTPDSKILTIPNGVDLEYFKPQRQLEKKQRLIFVGTMNWYPNVEAVLYIANELWPLLKKKFPHLHCDIIGANPPERILELSKKYQDFHVHGFVDDVRPYIETASVYVCPIQDGGGTKLKILDAMALESAMVAHPIACEGINVTDGDNVLLADEPATFVEKIRSLLDSPETCSSIGSSARLLMESMYGYEAIGKQLSDAFKLCAR